MSSGSSSGTLARYPLPRLLIFIHRKSFTGTLELKVSSNTVKIFCSQGWPEHTDLQSQPDLLGQILVEKRLITREQQELAISRLDASRPYGRVLGEMGLVGPEKLVEVLKEQLHRKLVRLFSLEDAFFQFTLEPTPSRLKPEVDQVFTDPMAVVVHGLKSHYTFERMRMEMGDVFKMAVKLDVRDSRIMTRIPQEPDDKRLLTLIDKRHWSMEEILAASGAPRLPSLAMIYALWCFGLLDVRPFDKVTEPRKGRPVRFVTPTTTAQLKAMATSASTRSFKAYEFSEPKATERSEERLELDSVAPPDDASKPLALLEFPPLDDDVSEQGKSIYHELKERMEAVDGQNLFQILGVPSTASRQEVKEAYLALAKKFHPDRVVAVGLKDLRDHTDRLFQRISEAFTTLLDDAKRADYRRIVEDKSLAGGKDRARHLLDAEVNFQKGEVFFRKGDLDSAEQYFNMAISGNPDEGEHHAMLAWTQYTRMRKENRRADLEEIKRTIAKAIQLSPKCARAHYFLGKILLEEKNTEEALRCFERAVEIKPQYLEPAREINVIRMRQSRSTRSPKGSKGSLWDKLRGK